MIDPVALLPGTVRKERLELGIFVGLGVLTLLVYGQVVGHEFVNYDVPEFITENTFVRAGLTWEGLRWAFTNGDVGDWQPLTWISLMIDSEFFGLQAGPRHLMGALYHLTNTLLFFLLLKKMTGALGSSAFAAALVAIHPLHVESVAWAAERKDVLSALFWLLTILAYLRYVKRRDRLAFLPVVLCYLLAVMSKPMVVTLPFVLLLLDYWPLGRFQRDRIWFLVAEKTLLWLLSLMTCFLTFWFKFIKGGVLGLDLYPLALRVANAFVSYIRYLEKTLWPFDLAVFYPYLRNGFSPAAVLGSVFLLAAVTILVLWRRKKYPYLSVGWFWFLGTLVPVIGLIQTGEQALADRYTYIPHMGLFLMVTLGIPDAFSRWRYKTPTVRLGALLSIAFFAVLAWRQVGYWKSTITLNEHALKVTGGNYQAHNNLGSYYEKRGEFEKAASHYVQSLEIHPQDLDVMNNLGNVLLQSGRLDEAIRLYRTVVDSSPRHFNASVNLGIALMEKGVLEEAEDYFRRALNENPNHPKSHMGLAEVLRQKGDLDQAWMHFSKALVLAEKSRPS